MNTFYEYDTVNFNKIENYCKYLKYDSRNNYICPAIKGVILKQGILNDWEKNAIYFSFLYRGWMDGSCSVMNKSAIPRESDGTIRPNKEISKG